MYELLLILPLYPGKPSRNIGIGILWYFFRNGRDIPNREPHTILAAKQILEVSSKSLASLPPPRLLGCVPGREETVAPTYVVEGDTLLHMPMINAPKSLEDRLMGWALSRLGNDENLSAKLAATDRRLSIGYP